MHFIRSRSCIRWLTTLSINRLRELKAKLKEQRKHLDELDKHMYVNSLNRPRVRPIRALSYEFR